MKSIIDEMRVLMDEWCDDTASLSNAPDDAPSEICELWGQLGEESRLAVHVALSRVKIEPEYID